MREMSVAEQRYQAVLAVIGDGRTVKDVAAQFGVSRQTVHGWLRRYEDQGLDGLVNRSHRPASCPHQMPAVVEVVVLELRRAHGYWGARRIAVEIARRELVAADQVPSESAVYRCLVRAGVIDPATRQRRSRAFKRWERAAPMELWQMDTVGGFLLADGSRAKALTGIDDHSRYCVSAALMPRERTQLVCDGLAAALRTHGVPQQILTDNGKVFTGRFNHPPVEVLFDRICRENGVEHLLTKPRSPTTTGKVERFHKALRVEFDTTQVFTSLRVAQQALDEWVTYYNTDRPHSALDMDTPATRFAAETRGAGRSPRPVPAQRRSRREDRCGPGWVGRRVASNGIVSVDHQQVSVGKHRAGADCDVYVTDQVLQFYVGDDLLKTVTRDHPSRPIRKKRASVPGGRTKQPAQP